MGEYPLTFAGSSVSLCCESREAEDFATFLFDDIVRQTPDTDQTSPSILIDNVPGGEHAVVVGTDEIYRGRLGVRCAALLFDQLIFHLLNHADSGIALHAGAIADTSGVILLPGQSGSGKSSLTGWLSSQGHGYLTDELVFMPANGVDTLQFFSRPVCLKPAIMPDIRKHFPKVRLKGMLADEDGAIIPHRSLNPHFSPISASPRLILLPDYRHAYPIQIENVSGAQTSMALMACNANGRNLADHGFDQIVQIARSVSACRVTYGDFSVLGNNLNGLLHGPDDN